MEIIAVWIDEPVKLLVVAVMRSATVVLTFSNHDLLFQCLPNLLLPHLYFLDW